MRHRMARGVMAALVLAASAAAAPDTPPAAGTKAGAITALLPTANIVRGPAKQPVTVVAKKGDEVVWNDLVRTDKGGRARITLLDQSILSVGSQAELRIIKSDPKSQQTSIEVGYGRVRMEVTPITKQGGSFEVKTPTAVAGVIGTTFGVDSSIGSTSFLCISGTVMIGSNAPNVSGQVPCPGGTVAVVAAGKAPVTRPATQQEIQQFTQDTEPAVISAVAPDSLAPGTVTDAVITGTQLGGITQVSSSNPSVTVSLNPGGTATSVSVHVTVAANAAPGPVTITLAKPSGAPSAAVLSIVSAQPATQGQAPSIKTLSTNTAPTTGGVTVTITGANFDPNAKVMFGNVAASNVTFVSSTQLTAVVPPGSPGTVDLTVVAGSGLTSTLAGGFSFGGPVPAIAPAGLTVNPGAPITLDGSRSSDTLAGTTLTYSWTLCSLGFKPPQVGAPLPPMSAPACNPAVGTVAGNDSQFSSVAPAAFGQYFARLQVTDNLGGSAVIYSSVTVSQPTYLDPLACTTSLAQAFSTLQTGSATGSGCGSGGAATVLGFFDPGFSGLTALQQALQAVFPTYSSMQVHLVG
ncbi:MAG TPA: FecR domain-containing protein, partial [Terriglobales bacterium]|nr:FecR domain-containing protein [Terriglobales bacterium]